MPPDDRSPDLRSATPGPRRVFGVDPGSRLCGWGLVEVEGGRVSSVDNGVVVLDTGAPLSARLAVLFEQLVALIATYRPTSAAVEGVFQHKNARSALILGHARGVALAALGRSGLEVAEYTPQQIKKAVTGTGRAEKVQVQLVVARRLGLVDPPQADAADAVAVALCHAQHLAFPLPVERPVPHPRRTSRARSQAALLALVEAQQRGVTLPRTSPPRGTPP
jgi:crossover junction endodeoxyribonuclease RuvC